MSAQPMNYVARMMALRAKLREAYNMAHRAEVEWNELNEQFKTRHDAINARRKAVGRPPLTDAEMRQEKEDNYALNDAFGAQGWWREQARLLADVILAEEAVQRAIDEGPR